VITSSTSLERPEYNSGRSGSSPVAPARKKPRPLDGAFLYEHMPYMLYILQSDRDGSFYIGHAKPLRHNKYMVQITKTTVERAILACR